MACRKMAKERGNPRGSCGGEEMVTDLPPSLGYDLMQNCDLPPPMKVYAGHDQKTIGPTMNFVYGMMDDKVVVEPKKDGDSGVDLGNYKDNSEDEKLELLKALRLSQTRAREAEKKAAGLGKEKNDLADFLLRQSMELFAYKQWVRMMELQMPKKDKNTEKTEAEVDHCECNEAQSMTWLVAVAICVSIAGVGFFSFFSTNYHH